MSTASDNLPDLRRYQRQAAGVGAGAMAICVIGALFWPTQFFRAYLSAYLLFLGLALGAMVILLIWNLTGGAWGFLTRRLLEAQMRTLPLLAVLFVPIACGVTYLYPWTHPENVTGDMSAEHREVYLNVPFWMGRAVAYFVLWVGFAYVMGGWSDRLELAGDDAAPRDGLRRWSGIGLVVYGITLHFASIDWVMSLQPEFHSTIFGPLLATFQLLPAQAFMMFALARLVIQPPLAEVVSGKVLNDVGNLLLSFLVLWAYMVFFQFMLIWIANMPVDIIWYLPRETGGWQYVAYTLFVVNFAVPFFMLLMRRVKQTPWLFGPLAAVIVFMQLAYGYYLVQPSFPGTTILDHWMDFVTPVAIGGLWLAFYLWQLARRPLLPRNDPFEAQAIHLRHLDEEEEALEEALDHA
jgi:hypothetical protein